MRKTKLCSVLLVIVLLLTACAAKNDRAGQNGEKNVPNQNETESGTLPAPVAPDASPDASEPQSGDENPAPDSELPFPNGTEIPAPQVQVSSAFQRLFPECPDSVEAVLVNAPFPNGKPDATVTWNTGEYDQLVLVPRYVGSVISAYRLSFGEDGTPQREETPVYTASAEDGAVIAASLDRPEGFPAWYVEVVQPSGKSAGLMLDYNGRTGTPPYEFICDPVPESDDFLNVVADERIVPLSESELNAFADAAKRNGISTWEAAERYFTQLTDIGDSAAFTISYGHEMDGSRYSFQIARMHQNYLIEAYGIRELVIGQYSIYEQLGNELGILGPGHEGELPDLTWKLTGLTVFNKLLAAKEIQVSVNGNDAGTYTLPQDQFCTLIPLELPEQIADTPIEVEITVLSAWIGDPSGAWIDAYGGISSNISGAR